MTTDSVERDGTQAEPNAEGSKSTSSQPSSQAASDVESVVKQLQTQVTQLARQLQSEKDRAVKQTNKRLDALEGDVRQVLQVAQQRNMSLADVLSELDEQESKEERQLILDMARSWKSGLQTQTPGGTGKGDGIDVGAVLSDLELSDSDIRVKEFRSRQFASEAEALREAIALKKKISTIQPSEADNPSAVSKNANTSQQEALMREYQEGSKNLRGQALINYKMQMRKKGLRSIS